MKYIGLLLIFIFFHSCIAQNKNNKSVMEKFNIAEFDKNKIGGEYVRTLSDGTVITQFGDSTGYFEKTIPPQGWFYSYKEFYGNGSLKLSGTAFIKGDYQEGTWIKYDNAGNKTGETNYNSNYHLTHDDIFKILDERHIPYSLKDPFFSIKRGVVNSKGIWVVAWKVKENRVEQLTIDDSSRAAKQDFYLFQGDH
jgi:hypothetical protein